MVYLGLQNHQLCEMETEMIQKTYHVSTCLLGIMLPQKTNKTPVPAILSHQHMDYDVTVIIR